MRRRVMQRDAFRTRLRERLHGAHDIRVTALASGVRRLDLLRQDQRLRL
jgi:hypothetical protein